MPTLISNTTTSIPTKTDEMTWDAFGALIISACSAERQRLTEVIPTPPITAVRDGGTGRSSDEWMSQYHLQQRAAEERTTLLSKFEVQLIVSIAEALETSVPLFNELLIEYSGSGDAGEGCDISVELHRGYKPTEMTSWGTPCFTNEENEEYRAREKAAFELLPSDLREWMDEICWSIAYEANPGFEINAGGFGTITVKRNDLGVMKVSLDHANRIEEVEELATEELN